MARFGTDIFKASISAVLIAILIGATTYVLTLKMTAPEPITAGTLEAYTPRGGIGPNAVSRLYFYTENVSIFAHVKDALGNPIANVSVTFKIHGPPNSNITLVETTKTNSSGVAVANLTAPYKIARPEIVLGIWSAVATTEIAGTQIMDSMAFEVESPPSPFVDVYTDRGGSGSSNSSQPYSRGESVKLFAKVSNGTDPVRNAQVTFVVNGPPNQTIRFLTSQYTNETGIATTAFTIANLSESIGTWQVIVTVRIDGQLLTDALTFECTS